MAATKIEHRSPFVAPESLTIGASAESIATSGGTIPQNTGDIWCYVPSGDSIHWHPTGTPTSSVGHAVAATKWFKLTHSQHSSKIISDDGSDVTMIVVYMRGGGRSDSAYSLTSPY